MAAPKSGYESDASSSYGSLSSSEPSVFSGTSTEGVYSAPQSPPVAPPKRVMEALEPTYQNTTPSIVTLSSYQSEVARTYQGTNEQL